MDGDAAPQTAPGLVVGGLAAGWGRGRSAAVDDVSLRVAPGEIVAVLGANGSGKSSLLWAIAGLLRPRAGTVVVDGGRIDGLSADRIARLGVRLLPQTRRVFPSLTVRQNLEVSDLAAGSASRAPQALRDDWLQRFPVLRDKLDDPAASLSGGEQQLVAIGRVASVRPRVLLLDEPSAGLTPGLAAQCSEVFEELAAAGTATVLVEQNVNLARRLAGRTLHMRFGALTANV